MNSETLVKVKEQLFFKLKNSSVGKFMSSIKPIYIIALVVVIIFVVTLKITNPHREYSTQQFWETATLESVAYIPEEALKPGNRNGGVLMWAAMSAPEPEIITALVERGADINESDSIFLGTPITGAAGYSKNPAVIKELVKLGADVNVKVHNNDTALIIAAQYNTNTGIIEELVSQGANLNHKNSQGKTALDIAKYYKNKIAEQALMSLMQE
jgi:ankyrin repeat protein